MLNHTSSYISGLQTSPSRSKTIAFGLATVIAADASSPSSLVGAVADRRVAMLVMEVRVATCNTAAFGEKEEIGTNDSARPINRSDATNASGASECAAVMLWTEE